MYKIEFSQSDFSQSGFCASLFSCNVLQVVMSIVYVHTYLRCEAQLSSLAPLVTLCDSRLQENQTGSFVTQAEIHSIRTGKWNDLLTNQRRRDEEMDKKVTFDENHITALFSVYTHGTINVYLLIAFPSVDQHIYVVFLMFVNNIP